MVVNLAAGSSYPGTDGSIVFPSCRNSIVGIKSTVGPVSRSGDWDLLAAQDLELDLTADVVFATVYA